jgi:hypothetical protein
MPSWSSYIVVLRGRYWLSHGQTRGSTNLSPAVVMVCPRTGTSYQATETSKFANGASGRSSYTPWPQRAAAGHNGGSVKLWILAYGFAAPRARPRGSTPDHSLRAVTRISRSPRSVVPRGTHRRWLEVHRWARPPRCLYSAQAASHRTPGRHRCRRPGRRIRASPCSTGTGCSPRSTCELA